MHIFLMKTSLLDGLEADEKNTYIHPEEFEYASATSKKRQQQFLAGRWLLRRASCWLDSNIDPLRSYVDLPSSKCPSSSALLQHDICFNISHSAELVAVALSKSGNVGIDIEFHYQNRNFLENASLFLSDDELAHLTRNKNQIAHRYYAYWTCKEALLKLHQDPNLAMKRISVQSSTTTSNSSSNLNMAKGYKSTWQSYQIALASRHPVAPSVHNVDQINQSWNFKTLPLRFETCELCYS